jgi:DMSO/TMAO reductase YedYZ molybdopterin-dependent catalytic subunit
MDRLKSFFGLNADSQEPDKKDSSEQPDKIDKIDKISLPEGTVVSPDTLRSNRIPPGQSETKSWPVLHAGMVPEIDLKTWSFRLFGLVEQEWSCNYEEFLSLPKSMVKSDFHCVTRWSRLNNLWEGVSTKEVCSHVKIKPEAKYVLVHAEHGWTTNMPIEEFLGDDCLFAYKHDGKELELDHGYPLRLVVPRLYAWKSAKWVRAIEFLDDDEPGFWEDGGYHMLGDPWKEQRFRWN